MTLMQKYQNQFQALSELLKTLNIKPVGLNKSSPKYKPYSYGQDSSYTKGVAADHIRIFPLTKDESFAFAFYYEKMDEPIIVVTIKRGEVIYPEDTSKYHPEAFRVKLNELVKLLTVLQKAKQLSLASLESSIKTLFLSEGVNSLNNEIAEVTEKIKHKLKPIKTSNKSLIDDYQALTKTVHDKKNILENAVLQAQKDHNVLALRKQYDKALKEVDKVSQQLNKQLNLEKLETNLRKLKWEYEAYQKKIKDLVLENSRHLPKQIQDKILLELEKEE